MKTLLLSVFLSAIIALAYGQPVPGHGTYPLKGCKPGWTNFGKFCYKYFFERLPFARAQEQCVMNRASPTSPPGYLITAKDQQHNRFQHNFLTFTGGAANKVWMGLAESRNNVYVWADGTPFRQTDWNLFKPDQPQNNNHIQAVHTFDNYPFQTWVTTNHETQISYICQYQYMP